MNSAPEATDDALAKFLDGERPIAELRSALNRPAARRWFRFSFRTLLAAMLVVGAFFAGMAFQKLLDAPVCRFENGTYIMGRRFD